MNREHTLAPDALHHDWDNSREASLVVRSGDVVTFELLITGHGQVAENSVAHEIAWDFSTVYNLAGPIRVEGARPGDTLQVEILELEPGPWGWTAMIPELGLLADEFPIRTSKYGTCVTDVVPLSPKTCASHSTPS